MTIYEGSSRYRIHYRNRTFVCQPRAPTKNGRYRWLSYYHNVHGQHLSSGTKLIFGYPSPPLLVNIVCVWPILFTLIVSPHYHVVRLTFTPRTQNTYDTNYSHHLGYYRKNMISPHGLIVMIIFQGDWPLLGCPRVNIRISSNSNPPCSFPFL